MSKSRSAYRKFPNVSKFLEEKIVRRRKEMKISQTVLATRAGLTRNCIQQMECHEHLPLPSTMFRLIKVLEFSEEETNQFWLELEEAYNRDIAFQEASFKTPEVV
jgi:predicted transcriptional regulator